MARVYFEVTHEKWGGEYDVKVPTWDEAELFEKITGLDYEGEDSPLKRTRGLAYIAIKREHPEFTWGDFGALALDAVVAVAEEGEPDPTPGEDVEGEASPNDESLSSPTSPVSTTSDPGNGAD